MSRVISGTATGTVIDTPKPLPAAATPAEASAATTPSQPAEKTSAKHPRFFLQTQYYFHGSAKVESAPVLECTSADNRIVVGNHGSALPDCEIVDAFELITEKPVFASAQSPLSIVARAGKIDREVEVEILGQTLTFEPEFKEVHRDYVDRSGNFSFEVGYTGILAKDFDSGDVHLTAGDLLTFNINADDSGLDSTTNRTLLLTLGSARHVKGGILETGEKVTIHFDENGNGLYGSAESRNP